MVFLLILMAHIPYPMLMVCCFNFFEVVHVASCFFPSGICDWFSTGELKDPISPQAPKKCQLLAQYMALSEHVEGEKTLVVQNMFEDHFPFLDYHFEGIPWYNTLRHTQIDPNNMHHDLLRMFTDVCWNVLNIHVSFCLLMVHEFISPLVFAVLWCLKLDVHMLDSPPILFRNNIKNGFKI